MATYAFSDLHAQYDLWQQIKDFIKPEDTVYCLGDCIDRGDVGLEILNEVIETPNIILLRGNHEDFIDSIGSEVMRCEPDEDVYWTVPNLRLWYMNGAEETIKAFQSLTKAKQKYLIETIRKLPTHAEYVNTKGETIYLCHAGRQPDTVEIPDMRRGSVPMNNFIWDRRHLNQEDWNGEENEYCVHGHTPIPYMGHYYWIKNEDNIPEPGKIFKYCNGHKINIDMGAFATHMTCLFNLDTFEPIYFKDRGFSDEEFKEILNGACLYE